MLSLTLLLGLQINLAKFYNDWEKTVKWILNQEDEMDHLL